MHEASGMAIEAGPIEWIPDNFDATMEMEQIWVCGEDVRVQAYVFDIRKEFATTAKYEAAGRGHL